MAISRCRPGSITTDSTHCRICSAPPSLSTTRTSYSAAPRRATSAASNATSGTSRRVFANTCTRTCSVGRRSGSIAASIASSPNASASGTSTVRAGRTTTPRAVAACTGCDAGTTARTSYVPGATTICVTGVRRCDEMPVVRVHLNDVLARRQRQACVRHPMVNPARRVRGQHHAENGPRDRDDGRNSDEQAGGARAIDAHGARSGADTVENLAEQIDLVIHDIPARVGLACVDRGTHRHRRLVIRVREQCAPDGRAVQRPRHPDGDAATRGSYG